MVVNRRTLVLAALVALWLVSGCDQVVQNYYQPPTPQPVEPTPSRSEPVPERTRVLSICLGDEPDSLFPYRDFSRSARIVRQALYDGPIDRVDYQTHPVILTSMPSQANGLVRIQEVQVQPGERIADARGELTLLTAGTVYRPAGCLGQDCAQEYQGVKPALLDQVVVDFELIPGLTWSDGEPLTAADSVYSYQLARSLFSVEGGQFRTRELNFTASFRAQGDHRLRWKGVPGFHSLFDYGEAFYLPLPEHRWGGMPLEDLLRSEEVNERPLGWGPYRVEEWVKGDHLSLVSNPRYFRAEEGLPTYDRLVFRFLSSSGAALQAFRAGECQAVVDDEGLVDLLSVLDPYQSRGDLEVVFLSSGAWEQLSFGIQTRADHPPVLADRRVRQAAAHCLNRAALVAADPEAGRVAHSYLPAQHPAYHQGIQTYDYQPRRGRELLDAAGWVQQENSPYRAAQGVQGIPDGSPLTVTYHVFQSWEGTPPVNRVVKDLQGCGFQVEVIAQPPEDFLAPGPDGPVFGRQFDLAQFAWTTGGYHLCGLFLSSEVPGPYPGHPKGWGGGNAPGYQNPEFDRACQQVLTTLPDHPGTGAANWTAQQIFGEDLPVLPLFFQRRAVITRFGAGQAYEGSDIPLWNIEELP